MGEVITGGGMDVAIQWQGSGDSLKCNGVSRYRWWDRAQGCAYVSAVGGGSRQF